MSIDIGIVYGILNRKSRQPQDERAPRMKGLDYQNRVNGKDVLTKVPVLDQSLEDLLEHHLTASLAVECTLIF